MRFQQANEREKAWQGPEEFAKRMDRRATSHRSIFLANAQLPLLPVCFGNNSGARAIRSGATSRLLCPPCHLLAGVSGPIGDILASLLRFAGHPLASLFRSIAKRCAGILCFRDSLASINTPVLFGSGDLLGNLVGIAVDRRIFRQGVAPLRNTLGQHTAHLLAPHRRDKQTDTDSNQNAFGKTFHPDDLLSK